MSFPFYDNRGFTVLESTPYESIVAKQERRSCLASICSILSKNKEIEQPPTLVKIKIENDTKKCHKVVSVQRLCGVTLYEIYYLIDLTFI